MFCELSLGVGVGPGGWTKALWAVAAPSIPCRWTSVALRRRSWKYDEGCKRQGGRRGLKCEIGGEEQGAQRKAPGPRVHIRILEPWLYLGNGKGFNLKFDLRERDFFISVAVTHSVGSYWKKLKYIWQSICFKQEWALSIYSSTFLPNHINSMISSVMFSLSWTTAQSACLKRESYFFIYNHNVKPSLVSFCITAGFFLIRLFFSQSAEKNNHTAKHFLVVIFISFSFHWHFSEGKMGKAGMKKEI